MVHAPLLVQRCNRLGPNGGEMVEATLRMVDPNVPFTRHITDTRNRGFGPIGRGVPATQIGEHVAVTAAILAGNDDTGLVGIFSGGCSRVDRYHDAAQLRRVLTSALV